MQQRPFWLLETRDVLAIILVAAMVGLMFVLVLRPTAIPDTVANIVIGGFMTVGFSAVIQFYFGSSKGSAAKDDTISSMATGVAALDIQKPVVAPTTAMRAPNVTPAAQSPLGGLQARP